MRLLDEAVTRNLNTCILLSTTVLVNSSNSSKNGDILSLIIAEVFITPQVIVVTSIEYGSARLAVR